jgi:tetratricopeptide (TPR) repeat protein
MRLECPKCKTVISSYGRCPNCGQILTGSKSPSFPILLCTVGYLAIIFVACLALYRIFSGHGGQFLWHGFSFAKEFGVSVDPPSVGVRGTSKPTLSLQDLQNLRDLFEKRQFDSLNKTASGIQSAFEQDPSYEYEVVDFYHVFDSTLPEYEVLLNEWVAHSPSHFAPYLARACYYQYRGWESRGQRYASETSEQQFEGMHSYFQKSLKDVDYALAINPRLLGAHIVRISIYNADGENDQEDAAFHEAQQYFPSCFLLYNTMAWAKLPRWGGSYAEMNRIAMQAHKNVRANPELYMLFGRIYADQAWGFRKNKQYDKALSLCAKAIRYGEYYEFFEERARTYLAMKEYDQALKDVNQCISLRPVKSPPYSLRATIYLQKGDLDAATQEISSMDTIFPGDFEVRNLKEWTAGCFLNQGHTLFKTDLQQAVVSYGKAIEVKPGCTAAYYWRGLASWKLKNTDLAYSDFEKAIRLDPHDFKCYQMMDNLLATQKRWDEIIEHWNRFLSLEPNNGDAYLERAGTYRHKGNMQSALADLRSACGLGNQKACDILKQNP